MWRSLAAHLLWEQGVGSSNLPIPTNARGDDGVSRRSDGSDTCRLQSYLNADLCLRSADAHQLGLDPTPAREYSRLALEPSNSREVVPTTAPDPRGRGGRPAYRSNLPGSKARPLNAPSSARSSTPTHEHVGEHLERYVEPGADALRLTRSTTAASQQHRVATDLGSCSPKAKAERRICSWFAHPAVEFWPEGQV